MKFLRPITFLLFGLAYATLAAGFDTPVERAARLLHKWFLEHPQEKVYLHLDRPYYIPGDTLWFKSYLTAGHNHQFSGLSGILYTDLLNYRDSLIASVKLPVFLGVAHGAIALPKGLPQGSYNLRAYTRWMQNNHSDFFFNRTILVGRSESEKLLTKLNYTTKDLQNEQQVSTTIQFLDSKGIPLSERSIAYSCTSDGKEIFKSKGITDQYGVLKIDFNKAPSYSGKSTVIETLLEDAKEGRITRSFTIPPSAPVDVQFFPEGGHLVESLRSRLGLKCIGSNGLGINGKIVVTDNEKEEVSSFETKHLGMGQFSFTPQPGKIYTARAVFSDGREKVIALPVAKKEGYVLSVYSLSNADSVLVRINCSPSLLERGNNTLGLIVLQNGKVLSMADIEIKRAQTSIWLSKETMQSGIIQFTLLSASGDPLNERVMFLQKDDQLNLSLQSDKSKYLAKDKVQLFLDAKDRQMKPAVGNFSISVIHENSLPLSDETDHTIVSDILLSSDLRGNIEKPNYYFAMPNQETRENLDILMLTQGYRRFDWREVLSDIPTPAKFQAENPAMKISGVVKSFGGTPIPNARVILFSIKTNLMIDTVADSQGRFNFNNLFFADTVKFTIKAFNTNNKDRVNIFLDEEPKLNALGRKRTLPEVFTSNEVTAVYEQYRTAQYKSNRRQSLNEMQDLKEVVVKSSPLPLKETSGNLNGFRNANQVIHGPELKNCFNLRQCLEGRLMGVYFDRAATSSGGTVSAPHSTRTKGPMAIFLDGIPYDLDQYEMLFETAAINPEDIKTIEVLRSEGYVSLYGENGKHGVIVITTRGWNPGERFVPGVVLTAVAGFNVSKEFYSPKYVYKNDKPDLRNTVYWKPLVITDKDGKAQLEFCNSDNKGTYKVTVEGIGTRGELGRHVFRYTVE